MTLHESRIGLGLMMSLAVGTTTALAIDPTNLPPGQRPVRVPMALAADTVEPAAFERLNAAAQNLVLRHPGARVQSLYGRPYRIDGVPMTRGATPEASARLFLAQHGPALGVEGLDLVQTSAHSLGQGRFMAYGYGQFLDGLPVERGHVTVVVRTHIDATDPSHNSVVLVKSRLAAEPAGGFAPDTVDSVEAVLSVKNAAEYSDLVRFTAPEMVVYDGRGDQDGWMTPVRAWKFEGEQPDLRRHRRFEFFVDAGTGAIVGVRSLLHFQGTVSGTVQGFISTGNRADSAANPPVQLPILGLRATASGVTDVTDAAGQYDLALGVAGPVNVDVDLAGVGATVAGPWVRIADSVTGTPILTATQSSPVPGTANLVINAAPTQFQTAMANAFHYQSLTHDYILALAPTFTVIDSQLPANVNFITSAGITYCNAYYSAGTSTNFFQLGGGCNNTAYASVISHEYGHHIVQNLPGNPPQGAFGEGFSDTMSMLMYDDAIIGRDFRTNGGVVRTPDTANVLYPCATGQCAGLASHCCGQLIGGAVWEVRKAFGTAYGQAPGLTIVRQLHADWAMITEGPEPGVTANSAWLGTAEDWVAMDDNDGNVLNGSPNYALLRSAFAQHNINLPEIVPASITFPTGLPGLIAPGTPEDIDFVAIAGSSLPAPGTGKLFYRTSPGGTFQQASVVQTSPNNYTGTIPGSCGEVEYYFSVDLQGGGTVLSPSAAPATLYSLFAGTAGAAVFSDDFEIDRGWVVTAGTPAATLGLWTRGDPLGTAAQPEDDHTAAGTLCFFTGQGTVGGAVGEADVDGGQTILNSPLINLAGYPSAQVEYWAWYDNTRGASPAADVFTVQASSNGTSNWVTIDTLGPSTNNAGGWTNRVVSLASFPTLALTSTMRFRFIAEDAGSGSIVEAALDDFSVRPIECSTPPCVADVDNGSGTGTPDGGVDISDLLYYLTLFDAGNIAADLDNGSGTGTPDGGVDISDLLYFLVRFDLGC